MVRLSDISSPTLVCAKEFYYKEGIKEKLEEDENSVLKNILEANHFDAIPLVDDTGTISRVARRSYHDGDPDDIFIIPPDEVGELLFKDEDDSNILDVIFFVVSSEHHIALTGPSLHKETCRIVTLDTLASESVREYLDHKVADVSSNSEPLDAHLSRDIFNGIQGLYEKTKKAGSKVPDLEFTKHAVDLLIRMQHLKNSGETDCDKENIPSGESWNIPREGGIRARDFAVSPMWGVKEDQDTELRDAALTSLSDANDFDQLLVFRKDSSVADGVWRNQEGVWVKEEHTTIHGDKSLDTVIQHMRRKKGPAASIIVNLGEEESKGIITVEELNSPPVLYEMMSSMVNLEIEIKKYIRRAGYEKLTPTQVGQYRYKTERASLGKLLSSEENFGEGSFGLSNHEIQQLTSFRNDLSHELFGKRGKLSFKKCYSAWMTKKKILEIINS